LVLVSFGQLAQASSSSVISEQSNTLTFTWEPGKQFYDDRAMFVVYNLEEGITELIHQRQKRKIKQEHLF